MKTETHEFLSDVRQVAAIRSVVRECCRRQWGEALNLEAVSQLQLAVQEAAANIVEHAYEGRPGQPIELEITLEERSIAVSLYDQGLAFEGGAVEPPQFDGTKTGGFGLHMIRESVDEVRYSREADGRNVVRLVKRM